MFSFLRRKKTKQPAMVRETPKPGGAQAGGNPIGAGAGVPPPEKKRKKQ